MSTGRRFRRFAVGVVLAALLAAACSAGIGPQTSTFEGFDGCQAGAGSAIVFLQRTLDSAGSASEGEISVLVPNFDNDVRAMMFRAREVHCTEDGFNSAVIARVDELNSGGPGGDALILIVRSRGLGSLDDATGGLISLP
ncbi:MAG: hypothetical protein ACC654_00135 [Acidimicrobiia bacterium]